MWTSAFVSPRLSELPMMLSSSLLFGPAGHALLIKRLIKKNVEAHEVMIAFLFHFVPDRLQHFKLIYQNSTYRLFSVGKQTTSIPTEIVYQPIYDADYFFPDREIGEVVDDSVLQSGLNKL